MNTFKQYPLFTYKHYRYILNSALESGYKFISFPMLKDYRPKDQLLCVLRHDCDNDLIAAARMARIEGEMGIRSTYFLMLRSALYNLMSIPNTKLIWEIIQGGHWIGLHFDELFYRDAVPEKISHYVEVERELLNRNFNLIVDVVSFHQPSKKVLNNRIKLNCVNTYDLKDMGKIVYISDSNMAWKNECPSKIFNSLKFPRVQLLLHPEWWTEKEMTIKQKWNQMLRDNFGLMQQSLVQRESTYNLIQGIRFYSIESLSVSQGNKPRRYNHGNDRSQKSH